MAHYINLTPTAINSFEYNLLQKVPYHLALYYLALPIAQENGWVTVVMAHPENSTALEVLAILLEAHIQPIRGEPAAITAAIHQLYPRPGALPNHILIGQNHSQNTAVAQTAHELGRCFQGPIRALPPAQFHQALTQTDPYRLAVVPTLPTSVELTALLQHSAIPCWLVRGEVTPLRSALVVLRGYASDSYLVQWLYPLIVGQELHPTFLFLTPPATQLADTVSHPHWQQILKEIEPYQQKSQIKFRQGATEEQIMTELNQHNYDLLVLAAEAYGVFVGQIFKLLTQNQLHTHRPILFIKPPISFEPTRRS